jgi:hypothetical protein
MSGSAAHIVAVIDKMKDALRAKGETPRHLYISTDIEYEIYNQCGPLEAYPEFKRFRLTRFLGLEVHIERGAIQSSLMVTDKPVEETASG